MSYLLHQLLERAATDHGQRPALRFEDRVWSYAELESRSNQIARALRGLGVKRGDHVGIHRRKGLETVAAMYGILKAGGAYVPLDPWTPPERIGFILVDCGIRALVTEDAKVRSLLQSGLDAADRPALLGVGRHDGFDSRSWEDVFRLPDARSDVRLTDLDRAYILHTSGSTGEPKGMVHTHASGLAFVEWAVERFQIQPEDRLGNHAPLHFDLSNFDYLAAAHAAASACIVPEAHMKMPAALTALIEREQLTVWYSVPIALLQMQSRGLLADRDLSSLRLVLFGGEPFPVDQLRALTQALPHAQFCHVYGVTETNVCTYHFVRRPVDSDAPLPIGRMCENMEGVVLDEDDRETDGEGELVVRGSAMMRGYWRRPDENARAFWRRPSESGAADVFYRTGDLVRPDEHGEYVFVGRKDRQIKSRGHRIELDEVQAAVAAQPEVADAAVFDAPDAEGSRNLVAAVTVRDGHVWRQADLVRRLRKRLPSYAVPTHFRLLQTMPRTSAGKVDWQSLLAGDAADLKSSARSSTQ